MKVKIFHILNKIQDTENEINEWLKDHSYYIHHITVNSQTENDYGILCIFYDITDKYSEIVSAIRGER